MKVSDYICGVIGLSIISAIGGAFLEIIVYPILFYSTHDCGKWICEHNPELGWPAFWVCFAICFTFFGLLMLIGNDAPANKGNNRTYRRNNNNWGGGRETDYFDSDMEGAPGYYGGGW